MSKFPLMAERPCDGGHLAIFHQLYAQGVRLFHVDATCTEDLYHPHLRAWVAPDRFDYSAQEEYWTRLLAGHPDAKLCLRMYVATPPWWDAAHPDELQRYDDGGVRSTFQRTDRETLPSLASKIWRRDAVAAVERFIDWLDASGWAKRVWGFFICYGITWEWGILGSDKFLDYSDPMRDRFRQWLRDEYHSVDALRRAWGDASITFESAQVPTKEARLRCDGDFRIFPRDRAAFDFQNCLSDVNAEHLLALSRPIREKAGDQYKIGTFYGYTLTARENNPFTGTFGAGGLHGGHHALRTVLDAKLFDFMASPFAYVDRDLGSGLLVEHFPLASVQHRGMAAYDENDLWTFKTEAQEVGKLSRGHTTTLELSLKHQRMAFAQAICKGKNWWWCELTEWVGPYAENYGDPALLEEIRRQAKWFEQFADETRRSTAQIALVIDERSIASLGLSSKLFLREIYQRLPAWAWCGAPFDAWLASDVSMESMRPYKLVYVFAPYLDAAGRDRLKHGLCHSNRTVWWAPFTGSLGDNGIDAAAFTALTGISEPTPDGDKLVTMPMGDWTSLYGRAADKNAAELAEIAGRAGVHLYASAPVQVHASDRFVGVHVRDAGKYSLALPPGRWRDVFTGEMCQSNQWRFESLDVALFCREQA